MANTPHLAGPYVAEFYESPNGYVPVKTWLDKLDETESAAMISAIENVLEREGMALIGTRWLTQVTKGVFEFRLNLAAADIKGMYAQSGKNGPTPPAKIVLRLFVHFYGAKVILLLNGYDKLADSSSRRQQKEIALAVQRLTSWNLAQARAQKASKAGNSERKK